MNTSRASEPDPWAQQERLLLSEVLKRIGRSLAPELALREMLHLMSELVGLNRGRLVLLDQHDEVAERPAPPDRPARIRHAYGLTRPEIDRGVYAQGEGITGAVLVTGQPMIVQDIDTEPRFLCRAVSREALPAETVAFLAVPVELDGRTVGVLACHRIRCRQRSLADDLALLRLLATLVGQVLQLSMLMRRKTSALEAQNAVLRGALQTSAMRYGIVGSAPALLKSIHELERVSQASVTVMLLGESGTGKELFARAVHLSSPRREGPFIKVNCAAIPETLFESELFGHERGAFTGATTARAGLFERAHGGTLFLDEIGEMPLALQSKLLRTLQEHTLSRLGGQREITVDVRVVVATHRNLLNEVAMGRFRRDLYYRLNVVPIRLPALRERAEDLKLLALHFLSRANQAHQRNVHFLEDAWPWLAAQPWPGNIRELGNLVERAVLLGSGAGIDAAHLEQLARGDAPGDVPAPEATPEPATEGTAAGWAADKSARDYRSIRSHTEHDLHQAMARAGGNQTRAAALLGLTPRQFSYRWKRLGTGT